MQKIRMQMVQMQRILVQKMQRIWMHIDKFIGNVLTFLL